MTLLGYLPKVPAVFVILAVEIPLVTGIRDEVRIDPADDFRV